MDLQQGEHLGPDDQSSWKRPYSGIPADGSDFQNLSFANEADANGLQPAESFLGEENALLRSELQRYKLVSPS